MMVETMTIDVINKASDNSESKIFNSGGNIDKHFWRQTLAATAAALSTLSVGFTLGYSAILLPQLKDDNIITINEDVSSWLASIAPLSMCVGCMMTGYITDKFGRRNSHMYLTVPFLIGCLLISFATNFSLLFSGRIIASLCSGAIRPLAGVFIGEMSSPNYRGYFLFGSTVSMNLGILMSHLVGTYLDWRLAAGICAVPPVIGFIIMIFLPESPTWLLNKAKLDEANKSFIWYKGNDQSAQKELQNTFEKQSAKLENLTFNDKIKVIFSNEFLKPFFTAFLLFITVQFCGINIIPFYATTILENTVGNVDPYIIMISLDVISVLASLTLVIFAKNTPRKPTFIICCIGTSISLLFLVGFMYAKPKELSWIPLVLLILYAFFSSSGIITLSWSFLAEIFPARLRGFGSGISASISYAILFVCVKVTPTILQNFGEISLFLIFAIVTLLCGCLLKVLLPETQGKTLQEIEDSYDNQ